jgi:hypothetical protein
MAAAGEEDAVRERGARSSTDREEMSDIGPSDERIEAGAERIAVRFEPMSASHGVGRVVEELRPERMLLETDQRAA